MDGDRSNRIGSAHPGNTVVPASSEGRKTSGMFKTSTMTRDVQTHPARNHIPEARGQLPPFKSLTEWEVETTSVENPYFNHAASLQGSHVDSPDSRKALKKLLNTTKEKGYSVISHYNKRLGELEIHGLMDHKVGSNLSRLITRDVQQVIDRLSDFERELGPIKKKSQPRDMGVVLEELKVALKDIDEALAMAKQEIKTNTKEVATPLPEEILKSHNMVPATTRLPSDWASLGAELEGLNKKFSAKMKNHQELEGHLQKASDLLEAMMSQASALISRTPHLNETDQDRMTQHQANLSEIQQQLQKTNTKQGTFSKTETLRQEIQPKLQRALETTQNINPWKTAKAKVVVTPPPPSHIQPSEIKTPALRQLVEELRKAGPTEAKKIVLDEINRLVTVQKDSYQSLIPLLTVATTKQSTLGKPPMEEVAGCMNALSILSNTSTSLAKAEADEEFIIALKKSDTALATLEAFDCKLPNPVWHLLTESLPQPPKDSDHLVNLMCRKVLSDAPPRLSGKPGLVQLEAIYDFHGHVIGRKVFDKTLQAYRAIVGEAFSSPASVRKLTEHARTLDEIRTMGMVIREWEGQERTLLESADDDLKIAEQDLTIPEVKKGLNALQLMTSVFADGIKTRAASKESARRDTLVREVKQSIEEYIQTRLANPKLFKLEHFKSDKQLCEHLEAEMNAELMGLATVSLTPPAEGKRGDIGRRVDILLDTPEAAEIDFNRLIRGQSPLSKAVLTKVQTSKTSGLVRYNPDHQCHQWNPYPLGLITDFGKDFADCFDEYTKGVQVARLNHQLIKRMATTRLEIGEKVDLVSRAIPRAESFTVKGKTRKKRVHKLVTGLRNRVSGIKQAKLDAATPAIDKSRDEVVVMLKNKEMTLAQAMGVLTPLFDLRQTLDTRHSAERVVMPKGTSMAPPEGLRQKLRQQEKKLRPKALFRLFRSKRLDALEHAQALVTICESCREVPLQAVKLLDDYSHSLTTKNPRLSAPHTLGEEIKEYSSWIYQQAQSLPPQEYPFPGMGGG